MREPRLHKNDLLLHVENALSLLKTNSNNVTDLDGDSEEDEIDVSIYNEPIFYFE